MDPEPLQNHQEAGWSQDFSTVLWKSPKSKSISKCHPPQEVPSSPCPLCCPLTAPRQERFLTSVYWEVVEAKGDSLGNTASYFRSKFRISK